MHRLIVSLALASLGWGQNLDPVFARFDQPGTPGCAVSVSRDGKIVAAKAYGLASLEHGVKLTPASAFHAASVSKQFTAAAVMLLALDGKLSLDDEIHRYVPELMKFGAPVTLRHLLHHTSGIRDQWNLLRISTNLYGLDRITDADVLRLLAGQRDLNFAPGSEHLYSNSGYTLLALTVKRVSGMSLRQFTRERIFEPLGMTRTFFRDNFEEVVPGLAWGYEESDGKFLFRPTNFDTTGATSLITTVEDLARWEANFLDPKVGGPQLVDRMLERGLLNDGSTIPYAAALVHGTYRSLPTVGHGGIDSGYRAFFLRFPSEKTAIAILCNNGSSNPRQLANRVADTVLEGKLGPAEPAPVEPAPPVSTWKPEPSELAAFAGLFRSSETGLTYRARVQDGVLYWQNPKGAELALEPFEPGVFRSGERRIHFRRDERGRVQTAALSTGRIRNLLLQREGAPHVVFVAGDDEYRSEWSLPMLARILEDRYGIRTTIVWSFPGPAAKENLPGLEALQSADLAVFYLRWRELPEHQLRFIKDYVESGRPFAGFRTTTHSFRYAKAHPDEALNDGFGRDIFGQKWFRHHGHLSTTKVAALPDQASHPVLRGVAGEFAVRSWLYEVTPLVGDCLPLMEGRAVNPQGKDASPQPVVWTKTYRGARVFFTTLGHPEDFLQQPVRRLSINGILWALGREVPASGADASLAGPYQPPPSGILTK
jgi:CubicO group peptidase (beta-lactamase class C family)/type 1 glutamine amidotransferase